MLGKTPTAFRRISSDSYVEMARSLTAGRIGYLALWLAVPLHLAVYFALYGDGTSTTAILIYKPAMVMACAFIALRIRDTSGRERQGWMLMLFATVAFGALDVAWSIAERDPDFPYPNWTDPFYLFAHAVNVVAVGFLVSPLWRGRDRRWMFDAGALLAVASGLLWHFVRPLTSDGSLFASGVGLAYLMIDLLMAGTVLSALYTRRLTLRNALILAAGFIQAGGDAAFYYYVDIYDTAWLISTWLIAIAAVTDPRIDLRLPRLGFARASLAPYVLVAVVGAVTLFEMRHGKTEDLLLAGVLALGLVVARQFVSLRQALTNERQETAFREAVLEAQSELGLGISILEAGRVVHANAAAERITGFTLAELTAMDSVADIFKGAETPEWFAWLAHPETPIETAFTRPDGSQLDLEIVARPMDSGDSQRLLLVARDITSRKAEHNALVQAQKFEGLGALAGGVAHDFNNLLSVVLGNVALLRMEKLDADAVESVDSIEQAAQRGAEMTRTLLDFSRAKPDHYAIEDVRECLLDTAALARPALPVNVRLRIDAGSEATYARLNRGLIIQALLNLVLNARDATGDEGEIVLAAREHPDGVELAVQDFGAGMDQATQQRIFEPFFTTKGFGVGTGLGLAITQRTVREHGGRLTVESAPGEGTTIGMLLPRIEASAEAAG